MKAEVAALLRADSTLMALLPGGVYTSAITYTMAEPNPFYRNGELKPCAEIRITGSTAEGPYGILKRSTVAIAVRQQNAEDVIESAIDRIKVVLNKQKIAGAGGGVLYHVDDLLQGYDSTLTAYVGVTTYDVLRKA